MASRLQRSSLAEFLRGDSARVRGRNVQAIISWKAPCLDLTDQLQR
jgi:hypothetical protein